MLSALSTLLGRPDPRAASKARRCLSVQSLEGRLVPTGLPPTVLIDGPATVGEAGTYRLNLTAVYNQAATESRNLNPVGPGLPDEPFFSKVSWDGSRFVIHTRGTAQGNSPPLETKRVIWIDADGVLMIERTAEGQPATRSVYSRAK